MDPSTNDWIDTFVKGNKKVVADKKNRGVVQIQEGKSGLSFQGFNIMCETICSLVPTGGKFTYQELSRITIRLGLLYNMLEYYGSKSFSRRNHVSPYYMER